MAKKKQNQEDSNENEDIIDTSVETPETVMEAEAFIDSIMPDEEKLNLPKETRKRRSSRKPEATRSLEKTMKILKTTRKVRFY